MVSEQPLEDRCGARVVDKIGIEIHADDHDQVFTDEDLEAVIIHDGSQERREEPEYIDVVKYLRYDYDVTAVVLSPSEADEDGEEEREVAIEDDDPYVTNRDTELQGYCERYPMDNGRCYVHGGESEGPGEGNMHRVTHGLSVKKLSGYYENKLDEEEKALVHALTESWIDNAPFDRDNFAKYTSVLRIAIDQVRLWKAQDFFRQHDFIDDFVVDYDMDGGELTAIQENPANLPYSRLDRDNFKKLKELGCLDDPDSQQADAVESLASKFADIDE